MDQQTITGTTVSASRAPAEVPAGWIRPRPERLPEPTYWPAALAFGITLLLLSVVTTWIVSAVGFIVFVIALAGWIGGLRRERRERRAAAERGEPPREE